MSQSLGKIKGVRPGVAQNQRVATTLAPPAPNPVGFGLKLLAVVMLYATLVKVALVWFTVDGMFGLFWPASGLALAMLLLGGRRYAWAVPLGTLLASAVSSNVAWTAPVFALCNTLEALIAHALLNRNNRFEVNSFALRSFLRLTLQAGVPAVSVSACLGALTLLWLGQLGVGQFWPSLLHWWMGNLLGIVLVTPLVLLWRRWPP